MKNTLLLFFFISVNFNLLAQPKVIAHRGYWNCKGSAENSIASLIKAHNLEGVYACELDSYITADGVVIVNHESTIEGHIIETSTYKEIKEFRLPNGEKRPTFKQYLKKAKKNKEYLFIEIKEHKINPAVNEKRIVNTMLGLVKKYKMESNVEYISFSINVCTLLKATDPSVKVAYLPRIKLDPKQIKTIGLEGIDYSIKVFEEHPEWVKNAHELGLMVNVYGPSTEQSLQQFIDLGVDFITTDNPVLLIKMLKE